MTNRINALIVAVLLTAALSACGGAIAPEELPEVSAEGGSAGAAPVSEPPTAGEGGSAGATSIEPCIGITAEIRCRGTEGAHPNCRGRIGTIEMVCGAEVEFRTAS